MAKKRMFTLDVVNSDAFLDLPLSSQALYFQLAMRADDDGFIGNPKRMTAYLGASPDDLKLLIVKRFLLSFPSGVVCIKHWKMHNAIRQDRLEPTVYQEEFSTLHEKPNKSYTDRPPNVCHDDGHDDGQMSVKCLSNVCHDDRIDIDIDIGEVKDSYRVDIEKEAGQTEMSVALDKNLLNAFTKYKEFRKSAGKPLTVEQQTILANKLNSFPEGDRLEIVNTATERGWMSFFPLDEKKRRKTTEPKTRSRTEIEYEEAVLKSIKEGSS